MWTETPRSGHTSSKALCWATRTELLEVRLRNHSPRIRDVFAALRAAALQAAPVLQEQRPHRCMPASPVIRS